MPVPSALPVPGHLTRTIAQSSMPISIPTPAIVTSPNSSAPPMYSNAKEVWDHAYYFTVHSNIP